MLYSVFTSVMNFLERTLGYEVAIRIKDCADYVVGIIFGLFLALYIMGSFYLEVDLDTKMSRDIAITRAAHGEYKAFVANPRTPGEVVAVFFGYVFLKMFAKKSIRFKELHAIIYAVGLIMALLFISGILLSMWDYLPKAGH